MPAYEYECKDCKRDFTIFLTIKEDNEGKHIKCPHCDSANLHKKFTAFFVKTERKA